MTGPRFKRELAQSLVSGGFRLQGNSLLWHGSRVLVIVSAAKGFGDLWHVDVGFWLSDLAEGEPESTHKSHLYFRLERLFPECRDTIVSAGSLGEEGQRAAFGLLSELLQGRIADELRELGSAPALSAAFRRGRLSNGIVTKEARAYLMRDVAGPDA